MTIPRRSVLLFATNFEELSQYLRTCHAAGCTVAAVSSFQTARAVIEHSPPDLLVSVLRLGMLDGLHLAIATRQLLPAMPIVVIGDDDVDIEAGANRIGSTYLARPVASAVLMELLQRLTRVES